MNYRMQKKLEEGDAIDLSSSEQTTEGDYILGNCMPQIGIDYCDSKIEKWFWCFAELKSSKRVTLTTGQEKILPARTVLGHFDSRYLTDDDFTVLWIR